ncbi:MAG TPA: hypothetical protein EYP56_02215 [Planctomycetaceae bacterium]|nr:hypothetical protein [Planctomycetaceae bacterium]HIQ19937.1 hypothetical protein [Planctomycetota bacterium]
MDQQGRTIVVRQRATVFVVFVAGGVFFLAFSWLMDNVPLWARLLFSGLSLVAIAAGSLGWWHFRIGLAIDRHGIWCSEYRFLGYRLIPWQHIEDAKLVWWHDLEGDHEGLLLELKSIAPHPCGPKEAESYRAELEALLGSIDFFNPVLLHHEQWQWSPGEVAELVRRCLQNPAERRKLGQFAKPK